MKIKPIKKPIKQRKQTVKFWSKKADRMLQEYGREVYEDDGCLLCEGEYSCLHHVILKSRSTFLRYKWRNLIPVCASCHMKFHSKSDPNLAFDIMTKLISIKGEDWYEGLKKEANANIGMSAGYTWYRNMYENLKRVKPYKLK